MRIDLFFAWAVFILGGIIGAESLVAQDAQEPADADLEIFDRLWVDATGTHFINGKLLDVKGDKARIQRTDNKQIIEFSLDALSLDDKVYCIRIYDAIQKRLSELKANDLDPNALIANQSVNTLDLIDGAVRELSDQLNAIESSDPTTLQRSRQFGEAAQAFAKSLRGKRLQVHFLVDDVTPTKFIVRDRRKIELQLSSPDISIDFDPKTIEVWIDTANAENLSRGDVLKMQGVLFESSRKSFGSVDFQLTPVNVADRLLYSYQRDFPTSVITPANTFRVSFYIHQLRKLSPADTKTFIDAQGSTQLPALRP